MKNLTIALDVMGGDNGPPVTIAAAARALGNTPQLQLILCGDQATITQQLTAHPDLDHSRLRIEHCDTVVSMDDKPSQALRNKQDSSMGRALTLVNQGVADACVSAGNTGALMALAYYTLGTLPGIDRPALVSAIPGVDRSRVYLLDLGANINADSGVLLQYAVMGSVVAEAVEGIARPRVGLLNVGVEDIKGNDQVKQANKLLASASELNYIGYVEGNDIFTNKADVIVTDGFVGNIALKSCEGLAKFVFHEARRISQINLFTRAMARIALPLLKKIYLRVNPDQYNGASLIGLRGIVVKSHGNASVDALTYAILQAVQEANRHIPSRINEKIEAVLGHD